ncbi:hypothetical protein AVEN_186241-1 [Araneus ventricosus]|uniref:Uncharacterized protein n=1 Tax=Araneus ventricosus TaxID=182803 RepID=A0A4Y2L2D4_ARAVE|nr:hypothetical protein AVEN_186241-1 [Araneus ventricosus]
MLFGIKRLATGVMWRVLSCRPCHPLNALTSIGFAVKPHIELFLTELGLNVAAPSSIMLPHRGGDGGPGWNGRCTSGVLSPGRVTQGVKVIPSYPAKA